MSNFEIDATEITEEILKKVKEANQTRFDNEENDFSFEIAINILVEVEKTSDIADKKVTDEETIQVEDIQSDTEKKDDNKADLSPTEKGVPCDLKVAMDPLTLVDIKVESAIEDELGVTTDELTEEFYQRFQTILDLSSPEMDEVGYDTDEDDKGIDIDIGNFDEDKEASTDLNSNGREPTDANINENVDVNDTKLIKPRNNVRSVKPGRFSKESFEMFGTFVTTGQNKKGEIVLRRSARLEMKRKREDEY